MLLLPLIIIADQACLRGENNVDMGGIMEALSLPCTFSNEIPRPVPPPTITWFRNGVLVASAPSGTPPMLDMNFLLQFPILNMGVFDATTIAFLQNGQLIFNTETFVNISMPALGNLTATTTPAQARAQLFNIMRGNWECVANNTLGEGSLQYNIRMCGKLKVLGNIGMTILYSRSNIWQENIFAKPSCSGINCRNIIHFTNVVEIVTHSLLYVIINTRERI